MFCTLHIMVLIYVPVKCYIISLFLSILKILNKIKVVQYEK